jgi:hypothetical protein
MPNFYLEPKAGHTHDPSWAVSCIKEGCWIEAETEELARLRVQGATLLAQDMVSSERLFSPWTNAELTDCTLSEPPRQIPAEKVLSKSGKILDAPRPKEGEN